MGLNLNSLKNLSSAPTEVEVTENTAPVFTTEKTSESSLGTTPINTENPPERTIMGAPKISLTKLRKSSEIDMNISPEKTERPLDVSTQEQDTIDSFPDANKEEPMVTLETEAESIVIPLGETTQAPGEQQSIVSESILIENEEEEVKTLEGGAIEEIVPEEKKEFFPKFHITNELSFEGDLEDLIIENKETPSPIGEEAQIIVDAEKDPLFQEKSDDIISASSDNETTVPMSEVEIKPIILAESAAKNPSNINTSVITPEYVAEVKTELSENRRAGFRFFAQHKTKILAGVSFVAISGLAMTFFSDSLFSTKIQESGKTNIQEITTEPIREIKTPPAEEVLPPPVQNEVTPKEEIKDSQQPNIPSYEIGRDYSITKNTKKNIRTKTDTGAIGTVTP